MRRIAKENKVDLRKVQPTGKGGRILKEDVISFLEGKCNKHFVKNIIGISFKFCFFPTLVSSPQSQPASPVPTIPANPPLTSSSMGSSRAEDKREPIKGFKKAMVRSMNEAWQKIPHFGFSDEVTRFRRESTSFSSIPPLLFVLED